MIKEIKKLKNMKNLFEKMFFFFVKKEIMKRIKEKIAITNPKNNNTLFIMLLTISSWFAC